MPYVIDSDRYSFKLTSSCLMNLRVPLNQRSWQAFKQTVWNCGPLKASNSNETIGKRVVFVKACKTRHQRCCSANERRDSKRGWSQLNNEIKWSSKCQKQVKLFSRYICLFFPQITFQILFFLYVTKICLFFP